MATNQTIECLQEGDRFELPVLIKSVRKAETRVGKPYLVLTVQDRTGELSGPVWDNVERVQEICQVGMVVLVSGVVQSYRDALQLKFESFKPLDQGQVDHSRFFQATPHDRKAMAGEFLRLVDSVSDPWISRLLKTFFGNGKLWQRFQLAPAAKGVHHAYLGGLLEHTLSVVKALDLLASHYAGVNRSLLLAGGFLHDIGKLEELRMVGGVVEYTDAGRLKGHLVISSELIEKAAANIKDFPRETLVEIQHLVLSHHGRLEFGSPTLPMTPEAFILAMVDDLDAKLNIMDQLRRKMDAGAKQWTDYQRILERYLLLAGYTADQADAVGGSQQTAQNSSGAANGRHQPSLF